MPKWSKGEVCKTFIRRFESGPRLDNGTLINADLRGKHFGLISTRSKPFKVPRSSVYIRVLFLLLFARVVELVDTRDLKSLGLNSRAGSIPAPGTRLRSLESEGVRVEAGSAWLSYSVGGSGPGYSPSLRDTQLRSAGKSSIVIHYPS